MTHVCVCVCMCVCVRTCCRHAVLLPGALWPTLCTEAVPKARKVDTHASLLLSLATLLEPVAGFKSGLWLAGCYIAQGWRTTAPCDTCHCAVAMQPAVCGNKHPPIHASSAFRMSSRF